MTPEAMPVEWASSMMNLASAYAGRIRGDRADNMEVAIRCYKQALEVRTRDAMPVEWAEAAMNLATAYHSRIQGDRAENIEEAIRHCEQALEARTRDAMPVEWGRHNHEFSERIRRPHPGGSGGKYREGHPIL